MTPPSTRRRRTASAVPVYLVILVSFQIFLVTVAVDAFATDEEDLGWATAIVSVVIAAGALLLSRTLHDDRP